MRVLLDTHAFLWANAEPDRLGSRRSMVEDVENDLLLSAASSWELATKVAIGRLELPEPVASYVPSRMAALGVTALSVEHHHALAVASLPMHHRDPFDRILIAQAQLLDVPIVTADPAFEAYDVEVLRLP
jgi:PIN domain nuclease of toxin-antitoxin system